MNKTERVIENMRATFMLCFGAVYTKRAERIRVGWYGFAISFHIDKKKKKHLVAAK